MNVANFEAILLGNSEKADGRRVLNRLAFLPYFHITPPSLFSTKNDNVFVYFVDHGGDGVIGILDEIVSIRPSI